LLWVLTFWFSVVVVGLVFLSVLFCCLFWVTQISGLRICGVAKSLVIVGKGKQALDPVVVPTMSLFGLGRSVSHLISFFWCTCY
jgi:hypothetical protein